MNQKAQQNTGVSTYVVGIILFGLIFTGVITIIGLVGTDNLGVNSNNTDINYSQYNSTFNVLEKIENRTAAMQSSIQNNDVDWGVWGVLNALIGASWNTMLLVFQSGFDFVNVAINGMTMFGVPAWFLGGLISLLSVILVFAIISAVLNRGV